MSVNKDLFLYDLAVGAILKNEGRYLKEWLDYHLLAGVEHFYLYNNDSTDNYNEIIAPYVEAGLVTSKYFPGNVMQFAAYLEAVQDYRFHCRYIAFIDLDEFIFPKNTTGTIIETADKILSSDPEASGLGIHWQCFGSNGQEKADYSSGVLERFTRRAKKDFNDKVKKEENVDYKIGNVFLKSILNPRRIKGVNIHYPYYFNENYTINENGSKLPTAFGVYPVATEKIVVNHYIVKSREEFNLKHKRGRADINDKWPVEFFYDYDRNDEFDDGILKYRAAREKIFSLKSDTQRISRVIETLIKTLSQYAAEEISDLETALTCWALSAYLLKKFPNEERFKVFEEASLAAILKSLDGLKLSEVQLLMDELPNLLILPYPIVEELRDVSIQITSQMMNLTREKTLWKDFLEWNYLHRLLKSL
ncbi:MAG: glycosyltransferase family 92 protein [Selenomonadaceae bacterium]|nr:glycosyltransferase family 92 protein [Selenomonadaceae bacterium]